MIVQPVSLAYVRLDGMPIGRLYRPFFAWYGAVDLAPHMWSMVGLGTVEVVVEFHPPDLPLRLRVAQGARRLLPCADRRRARRRAVRSAAADAGTAGTPPQLAVLGRHPAGEHRMIANGNDRRGRRQARPKRVFIKTYGCQMNVYDSARMADLLAPLGFTAADTAQDADLVILNTCHIREKAAEKVYSELGTIRRLKAAKARRGGRMIVAVAGCVAQAEGAEIMRRAPCVDLVFGPQSYHRLPELVARALRAGGAGCSTPAFRRNPNSTSCRRPPAAAG